MRLVLALVLFVMPCWGAESVKDKVSKWHANQRVEVMLSGGEKLTGRLGSVTDTGFALQPEKKGKPSREFGFAEVSAVSTKMTTKAKWTIAAAIWGGLALVGSRL